jgi:hypothetical protein
MVGGQSSTAIISDVKIWDVPPELPTAFPNVISLTPTLPCSPNACVIPLPCLPYTPVECASSTTTHCLSLVTCSSSTSNRAGNGAKSPSIEYNDSTVRNTVPLPSICFKTSLRPPGSLCRKGIRCLLSTRLALNPEWTLACTSSSYITQSPGCGTVAKNETLASHPELNSNADGASKNSRNRVSRAVWSGVEPESSLEPVDPRMRGDSFSLRRKEDRKDAESVKER